MLNVYRANVSDVYNNIGCIWKNVEEVVFTYTNCSDVYDFFPCTLNKSSHKIYLFFG